MSLFHFQMTIQQFNNIGNERKTYVRKLIGQQRSCDTFFCSFLSEL